MPTGTPILVPILPIEFSNFDTTTGNGAGTIPGNNTAAQLRAFAKQAALPALGPGGALHLSVNGQSLSNPGAYREIAPTFSYVLPADSLNNAAFGQSNLTGPVSPAEADGFLVMLKPLSPGHYVINAGGVTPGGSLGPLNEDVTWTIDVLPKGQFEHQQGEHGHSGDAGDLRRSDGDGHESSAKRQDDDVLGRASGKGVL